MGLQPGAGNTRDTTEESRPEMMITWVIKCFNTESANNHRGPRLGMMHPQQQLDGSSDGHGAAAA
jgi:hypothetical protein